MKRIKYYERKYGRNKLVKSSSEAYKAFRADLISLGGLGAHIALRAKQAIRTTRENVRVVFGAGNGALDSMVTVKAGNRTVFSRYV